MWYDVLGALNIPTSAGKSQEYVCGKFEMNIFSLLTLKLCPFPCWEVRGSWLSAANHIVCLHSLETEALYFSFPHPALWSRGCVFSVIECQVGFRSRNQNMNGLNESCAPLWCPLFKADAGSVLLVALSILGYCLSTWSVWACSHVHTQQGNGGRDGGRRAMTLPVKS